MIGIYKITNKNTGKSYIGQSNDIERRFKEHQIARKKSRIPVDIAIQKYGKDLFTYEIVEECLIDQLNEREKHWTEFYDTFNNGYNCNQSSIGENNGRAKLTESDVKIIRQAYANHERQKDIYELFKDKISFRYFQNVWRGASWTYIMPEVFSKENKNYYIYDNSNGSKAKFSNEEILTIRKRYVNENAKEIYKDYKDRIGFQAILQGRSYSTLPLYKKKRKAMD